MTPRGEFATVGEERRRIQCAKYRRGSTGGTRAEGGFLLRLRQREGSFLLLLAVLTGAFSAAGAAEVPGQTPLAGPEEKAPITITSEKMEYSDEEKLIVFTGNVVAAQGDATTTSERMEVTVGEERDARGIVQIVALGKVSFRQVDSETGRVTFATGEKAVFSEEEQKVTITGSPKVWEDENVIVGETIIFHFEGRRLVVEGGVGMTFYPKETEGEEGKE